MFTTKLTNISELRRNHHKYFRTNEGSLTNISELRRGRSQIFPNLGGAIHKYFRTKEELLTNIFRTKEGPLINMFTTKLTNISELRRNRHKYFQN